MTLSAYLIVERLLVVLDGPVRRCLLCEGGCLGSLGRPPPVLQEVIPRRRFPTSNPGPIIAGLILTSVGRSMKFSYGSRSCYFSQWPSRRQQNSKSNKQKNYENKILFFVGILSATDKKAESVSQWYRSVDPDPYQNVTDLQHYFYSVCFRDQSSNLDFLGTFISWWYLWLWIHPPQTKNTHHGNTDTMRKKMRIKWVSGN